MTDSSLNREIDDLLMTFVYVGEENPGVFGWYVERDAARFYGNPLAVNLSLKGRHKTAHAAQEAAIGYCHLFRADLVKLAKEEALKGRAYRAAKASKGA